jgi:hypothetical protein
VERAKSGRAKCRACGALIDKGALRIGTEVMWRGHATLQWQHARCCAPMGAAALGGGALAGWEALDAAAKGELLARAPKIG